MIFGELNSALAFFERILRWTKRSESIADRFIQLFDSHGVHRNQIPRFFGHGLTIADVQDNHTLLARLSEEMLADSVEIFAVRREWMDGADQQVHPVHRFYKHPEIFAAFLDSLISTEHGRAMEGVVVASSEQDRSQDTALLTLQETIGHIGNKPIYRFHLCDNWPFSYWKARGYLTACVAIAWKRGAFIHGAFLPSKDIERLAQGNVLLGWHGEGIWELGRRAWDPEDMALRPEVYLKGLDPEINDFGIRAALELWLDLARNGLMDPGLGNDSCPLFEREYLKHLSESDT